MNLAFAALVATVLQWHTEVSGASWLQLLMSNAWLKVGITFPPGLLHQDNNPATAQVPSDQMWGKSTKEPKQMAC